MWRSKSGDRSAHFLNFVIGKVGNLVISFHASDVKSGTLANYIRENVSKEVDVVMTDDFSAYPKAIAKAGVLGEHKAINHSLGIYSIGDLHTISVESAFSLLKRGIVGTWYKVSAKHLEAYLNEMSFRFNNRKNPFLFRDTLLRMLEADNGNTKNSPLPSLLLENESSS